MALKIYNKLVRDNIPAVILGKGGTPFTRLLNDVDFITELKKKLVEEANEVNLATSDNLLEELADISEVVNAFILAVNSSPADIERIRVRKMVEKGGFSKRIFLEKVEEK